MSPDKNSFKETDTEKGGKEKKEFSGIRELINWVSLMGFLYGTLDDRLDIREALEKQLKKPVPKHVNWLFCFGGITFLFFIILTITGILLLMYYRPTTAEAYKSVVFITNEVPFGWLIRGIHHWAANLMIVTVIIHMLRVYFHGAYKPPRDFNWIIGVFLLLITFAFGFTGYLLPWSQVSFWGTTIGTEAAGAVPVIGETLLRLIRGSSDVSQITLTRFFAVHVVILPLVFIVFVVMHFLVLRKQGISEPL